MARKKGLPPVERLTRMKVNGTRIIRAMAERSMDYKLIHAAGGPCSDTLRKAIRSGEMELKSAGRLARVLGIPVNELIEGL